MRDLFDEFDHERRWLRPPRRRRRRLLLALPLVATLTVVSLALGGRADDPGPPRGPGPPPGPTADQRALEAGRRALQAWGRFAVTNQLGTLRGWFWIRKANSSGMFALLVVCAAYLFFSLSLLAQNSGSWAVVLGILAIMNSIGAACALGALLSLIRQQYYWKGYWQERLFEIMASAKGDHDLFNRCIILRREIASEPDVPIPGAVTTYVVLFSAIQTVLLWVSHRVSWL